MKNIDMSHTGINRNSFNIGDGQAEKNGISQQPEPVLYVAKNIYPAECVIKAAYVFLDKAYVHLDEDVKCWIVELEAKEGQQITKLQLQKEFENELIAQAVRLSVFKRTHTLREMLLARAMSSSLIEGDEVMKQLDIDEQIGQDEQLQHILKDWYEKNE